MNSSTSVRWSTPKKYGQAPSFERTLGSVDRTVKNVDATITGPDAPAQQELRDALVEFTRAARSLRVFLEYLERHPESPIRGKAAETTSGSK